MRPADIEFADSLPEGENHTYALDKAIDNWSLQDPAGMAAWLNTLPPGDEFDFGVAMMIIRTDGANRDPDLAMQWVENIKDSAIQQASLRRVLSEWRQSDPNAAQQYAVNATWLDEGQRQAVLKYITSEP